MSIPFLHPNGLPIHFSSMPTCFLIPPIRYSDYVASTVHPTSTYTSHSPRFYTANFHSPAFYKMYTRPLPAPMYTHYIASSPHSHVSPKVSNSLCVVASMGLPGLYCIMKANVQWVYGIFYIFCGVIVAHQWPSGHDVPLSREGSLVRFPRLRDCWITFTRPACPCSNRSNSVPARRMLWKDTIRILLIPNPHRQETLQLHLLHSIHLFRTHSPSIYCSLLKASVDWFLVVILI